VGDLAHERALCLVHFPWAPQHQDQALGAALLQAIHEPRQRCRGVGSVHNAAEGLVFVNYLAAPRDDFRRLYALHNCLHGAQQSSGILSLSGTVAPKQWRIYLQHV
jgi:hypothetical protein